MIPPFVRRREPSEGMTWALVPYTNPMEPEAISGELRSLGAGPIIDRAPDPVRQSDFLGGRGRPVFPGRQDVELFINPATGLGGEGASWEWEHFGYKMPMPEPSADSDARTGALNAPLAGYAGMIAWPERTNEYRPPWESYSSTTDQRLGVDDSYVHPDR